MILVYKFSPFTYEFTGSQPGKPNPKDPSSILVPANATTVEPMAAGPDEIPVWSPGLEEWSLVEDYRGQTYYTVDGQSFTIQDLGPVSESLVTTTPPPGPEYTWTGSAWEIDPDKLAAQKLAEIELQAQARETGDFFLAGNAITLGKHKDNLLIAQVLLSATPPTVPNVHGGFWRANDKSQVALNDAQMQAFAAAAGTFAMQVRQAAFVLEDAVEAAKTGPDPVTDLQAIDPADNGNWPTTNSYTP